MNEIECAVKRSLMLGNDGCRKHCMSVVGALPIGTKTAKYRLIVFILSSSRALAVSPL